MKQTILILLTLLCFSCSKENTGSSTNNGGQVVFNAAVESNVISLTKASDNTIELPTELIPAAEDFALRVTGNYIDPEDNSEKDYSYIYNSIFEQNEKSPYLTKGNYNAAISCGEVNAEGAEKPYFAGNADFTIIARDIIDCNITAALTNSAIQLTTTEWFNKYYTSATFTVTTSLGNSFTFKVGESSPLIFVNAGTTLSLSGTATKSNGFDVEFPARNIGETTAQTQYTIVVDAGQAGEGNIKISFDETTTIIDPIEVELNPEA